MATTGGQSAFKMCPCPEGMMYQLKSLAVLFVLEHCENIGLTLLERLYCHKSDILNPSLKLRCKIKVAHIPR